MNKLAIVGTHTRTRELAPFDDLTFDIWTFNEAPQAAWCKRWDVNFQLHKPEVYTSPNNFVRRDHWDWLQQKHGKPIYMQDADPRVPDSRAFPLYEIIDTIPGAGLRWFKSSPAYALALAIYLGYEEVALYGLDMSSNTEYGYQLPNFQFWVGIALGAGVKVDDISNAQYFTGTLYAYEGETQIDRAHFDNRVINLRFAEKSAKWELEKLSTRYAEAIAANDPAKAGELVDKLEGAHLAIGEVEGALDLANEYSERFDPIPRQEFERRAAQAQRDAEEKRKEMWIAHGEMQYIWNVWRSSGNLQARDQFMTFAQKQLAAAHDCGVRTGAMRENMDYMVKVSDLIEAAGGARTLALEVKA